jgi:multidrug efflux pump subunit AcrA (membrane-fusion protein)
MKKSIFIIAVALIASYSCRNQEQNLTADVEIPVSTETLKLKSIEEFLNTTGTAFPKGEITLKTKITATYFLERNPGSGKFWQLGDKIKTGMLIAHLEDKEYVNSLKLETNQLNLELSESELRKQESLYEKGGVTLKELKTAGINYENAKTTVENSKLQMDKTKVIAPIDGVIVELPYFTQNTQVETGSTIARIRDSVIVIPKSIILSRQRGKTVFIVDRGVAEERIIETGLENITDVEVLSGLAQNDLIVTRGFETLSNKSKVKIIK